MSLNHSTHQKGLRVKGKVSGVQTQIHDMATHSKSEFLICDHVANDMYIHTCMYAPIDRHTQVASELRTNTGCSFIFKTVIFSLDQNKKYTKRSKCIEGFIALV